MGKLIFIAIIVLLVYWIIRSNKSTTKQEVKLLPETIENMVCCKQCGVHLPENESIAGEGNFFCSNDHHQKYLNSQT